MGIKIIYLLICSVFFAGLNGCKSFLKFSAIPKQEMAPSEEIKYISQTDQRDRRQNLLKFIFLSDEKLYENKKVIAVSDRDSIRLRRIIQMNVQGLINTETDRYNAAYIYFHGGGLKMQNDTMYFRIAHEMFKDLAENATDKKWKKRAEVHVPLSYNRWQEELSSFE